VVTELCRKIWSTGEWPEDWKKSVFIPIPKKGDARLCENNWTISLISHVSKVLLKIIQGRMESHAQRELPDVQAGFRKLRGTRDQIGNVRRIMERAREFNQEIFLCFIDYSKAFDCVDHAVLWQTLRTMGIPEHLIWLLRNLYHNQKAEVRTEYGSTETFGIGKGVRQGCILSPTLFNLYAEKIMREAIAEDTEEGIRIGGRTINNLRYADDTTLASNSETGLQSLWLKSKRSEKAGLFLNVKKTKVLSNTEWEQFIVEGEEIEVVKDFIFWGSRIVDDGTCWQEIKKRVMLGRTAMSGLDRI
jgi:hypothetical protein